jgi:sugar phosphate isomerase/epimerase
MIFGLSTRWNASRHATGEALVDEIVRLGITRLELGYDLRIDLVPGVKTRIATGTAQVVSVHNFCPVPVGAPAGHPELYTLAAEDPRTRESALRHTRNTIRFAADMGARCVILHGGNVEMPNLTLKLMTLGEQGRQFDAAFDKTRMKLFAVREKKIKRHLDHLYRGIEQLLPTLQETGICLALENLPSGESLPNEAEMEALLSHFASPHVRYWHDIGHAYVREWLGFSNQRRWLERLEPYMAGWHVHDVAPPACDHLAPAAGHIDFTALAAAVKRDRLHILEPHPAVPAEALVAGLQRLQTAWETAAPPATADKRAPNDGNRKGQTP